MRVGLLGTVESTRVALESLPGVDVLWTLPPEMHDRHSDYVDLRCRCKKTMEVSETNTPEFVESVSREQLDILYVIGWSRIVHHDAIVAPKLGTIGYHPAPLPLMRGRAVIPWTILLGVERTASTLFWMDDDIDHGPIAAQEFFDVDPRETATTLYKKHMAALRLMLSGDRVILGSKQQDHAKATYCAKRTPADGEIDWSKPPEEIDRLIRAVTHPYPGAWTMIGGKKVTIWEATVE